MKWLILVSAIMFLFTLPATANQAEPAKEDPAMVKVQELLRSGDSYSVAQFLEREGAPRIIARRYFDVMNSLYWKKHDLPATVAVARFGIHYSLSRAQGAPEAEAADLKGVAKSMAYDLASFTWPGWNEPGISTSKSDEALGLDAARLNLRLAVELKRGPEPMFNAYWVLGAQEMASGKLEEAVRSFESGVRIAREAGNRGQELMGTGFALLAKWLAAPDAPAEQALAANAAALVKEKDGPFYQEQIVTARKVFAARFKR